MSEVPLPSLERLSGAGLSGSLGERFRAAGLTRELIRALTVGEDDLWSPLRATREAMLRDDEAACLLRLFLCGLAVTREEDGAALGADSLRAVAAGLLEADGDTLRGPFHMRLVRGLYLVQ